MKKIVLAIAILFSITVSAQKAKKNSAKKAEVVPSKETVYKNETLVEITTNYGVMIARLYNSTPLHKANFIKLIKQGFYDSLLFHRVINGFMLQGGDPTSKNADSTAMIGNGSAPGPMIPAEFRKNIIHKKGALAAARDNNAEKSSHNSQFYIVQGRRVDTTQLTNGIYSQDQKEIYQKIGGANNLDQEYTVFGEVFIGMDVIDAIAMVPVNEGDRPKKNVIMKIKVINN
jgi:cyclophilin family peptidyl-prolyl cis-trans isomerase